MPPRTFLRRSSDDTSLIKRPWSSPRILAHDHQVIDCLDNVIGSRVMRHMAGALKILQLAIRQFLGQWGAVQLGQDDRVRIAGQNDRGRSNLGVPVSHLGHKWDDRRPPAAPLFLARYDERS
jgi:hypothetical protein